MPAPTLPSRAVRAVAATASAVRPRVAARVADLRRSTAVTLPLAVLAAGGLAASLVAPPGLPPLDAPADGQAAGGHAPGHITVPAAAFGPDAPVLSRTGWRVRTSGSASGRTPAAVLDGLAGTAWVAAVPGRSWVELDLPAPQTVAGLAYRPSTAPGAGRVGRFEVSVSRDGVRWGAPVATGRWADDVGAKRIAFAPVLARHVRLIALDEAAGRVAPVAAAELDLLAPRTDAGTTALRAQTVAAVSSSGVWSGTIGFPLVPAAAAVLPNNKVLLWSAAFTNDFPGGTGRTETAILDLATMTVSRKTVINTGHDMFCPGVAILPDGRIMVTGGNDAARTSVYDPATDTWEVGSSMAIPRAYHGMAPLPDGGVFTIGGSWNGGIGGKDGEVWTTDGGWRRLPTVPVTPILTADPQGMYRADNHPWLLPTSGGRILQAGPSRQMNWINAAGNGAITPAGPRGDSADAMNGNAVMYDVDRILTLGGATAYQQAPATNRAYRIDARGANPVVTRTGDLASARAFVNSVPLPDGTVLALGGQSFPVPFSDATATNTPELWSPATNTFTSLAPSPTPRTYHSWAMLLPDGRVISGGGGLCGGCTTNHPDAQVFTPPYLLNADGSGRARPVLTGSPANVQAGTTITVTTDRPVASFAAVRHGAATHSVDNDQRRIPLQVVGSAGNTYTLALPADRGVLLPGPWMLFALDGAGTPSVSRPMTVDVPGWKYVSAADSAPVGPRAVVSAQTGKCLDVDRASPANDAAAIVWNCTGATNQVWSLDAAGRLVSPVSGKCLDVYQGSVANDTPVVQFTCNGQTNQQWVYNSAAGSLVSVASGKCLDVYQAGTLDGTKLVIWPCSGAPNQQWRFTVVPRQRTLVSAQTGKCLDLNAFSAADNAKVSIWTCSGGGNENWTLDTTGSLVSAVSGKCLDVFNGGVANATPVLQFTCNGQPNQKWTYDGRSGALVSKQSGKCLDVFGAGTADGTGLVIWPCSGAANQQWRFSVPPGSRTAVGAQSGKCLDVDLASTADNAKVQIWTCNGAGNQAWSLTANGSLVNANSGKCLDVFNAGTANDTPVLQFTCNGQANQQWTYDAATGELVGKQSGKCLDVFKAATLDGTGLVLWPCQGTTNQQWLLG